MDCKQAQPLVSSYADGELSELQAGSFRKHLMDCQPCRALVQEAKSFQSWFVSSEPVAVPSDFAARVARRAFAGDTGEFPDDVIPAAAPRREAPILQFSLRLAVAAALVLMVVSIGLGVSNQPDRAAPVSADQTQPELHEILEELDALRAEDEKTLAESESKEADSR